MWTQLRAVMMLTAYVTAACEARTSENEGAQPATEAAPAATAPTGTEVEGYDPRTLAWLREGRPVIFEARAWRPVGRPLAAPYDAFRRVGEFEGMALYAAKEEVPPYHTLFFPLGNELWQPLEPTDAVITEQSP